MEILFKKDWQEHPGAIVDLKTTNDSFLRYCALLKTMGIENYHFPLALYHRELQGVDPFSLNLAMEQKLMIAAECKLNFWYFLREIARTADSDKANPTKFKANRGNISMFWLFWNHITNILIQIRQTGKSFSSDTLSNYLLNIRCTDTEINLLTKDDTLRAANLERLKGIQNQLPYYLKQHTRGDVGNTEELSVKALKNRYRGHLPNKSPKMALNVGRGLSSPIFLIDEAAFFFNIGISMGAALAAGTAKRNKARDNNEPYGTIITTTAGKKDDRDGLFVYQMVQESAIWTEKFYDCKDEDHLKETIRSASSKGKLRVNSTFNHRQLGYTDEWLKRAIEEAEVTGDDADRDFGNVWTSGTQSSPLSTKLAEIIRKSEVLDPDVEVTSPYGYILRWFLPQDQRDYFMENEHHIISIDSSDAVGDDDISVYFRSIKTGATVAAATVNETNLISFSEWVCELLIKYEKTTLIIERRSSGAYILDYIILMLVSKGIDPFKRIYNKCVQDAEEERERFNEISKPMYARSNDIYVKYKKTFGWATSATGATSRTDLYGSTLQNAAKMTGDKVKDKKTIDQILSLVIRNNRVDHDIGSNDDHVISWLLSFWLITLGKNLHFYGINSRDILIENEVSKKENDPITRYDNFYQMRIRSEIETLVEEMKREKDEYLVTHMERKLRALASELTESDKRLLSLDELMIKLKEYRKGNVLRSQYR